MPFCSVCKREADCRIRTDSGAFGPVDVQTCEPCHAKEIASVKAEAKRFKMRLRIPKPWSLLTARGAFTEVR